MRKFTIYNLQFTIKFFRVLAFIFVFSLYIVHSTFYITPVYAEVKIGEKFGFGGIPSFGEGISKLVTPGFSIAAVLVVLYFLFGAFKFLASGGDKEEIAAGRNMITHAIIGFIILIFAFVIMQFLLSSLFGITSFQIF